MRLTNATADDALLREVGERLARARLDRNLTQAQMAEEAGVAKATIERLERGESTKVVSLLRVLRVLGLIERLDRLIPEDMVRPIEEIDLRGRRRQRARPTREDVSIAPPATPWRWGDERE